MDLSGKHGVILGVANDRSIAWQIAQATHRAGARLALNYQNERFEEDVRKLAGQIPESLCMGCDLMRDDQIDHFFEHIEEQFEGKLDFLVHSVAFAKRQDLQGRFIDTPRDGFNVAMEVSVHSLVAATRRAFPLMQKVGGGSVMTMSYLGGQRVMRNYNVMGVAKAALEAAARYLAADLGPEGTRVNILSPGPVRTVAASGISGFKGMLRHAETHSALKRNINPEEVGQAAVFLASDAASGITGQTLYVDAGYHIMGL